MVHKRREVKPQPVQLLVAAGMMKLRLDSRLKNQWLLNFCRILAVDGDILLTMTTSDLDLLQQYARQNSEEAFATLVQRHLDLVYSAALRQVRSPQLAEEVSQSVFADLARNAGKLKSDTILTAWLYAVTWRTAIDVVRKESRRQFREQIAVEMTNMNATAENWTHIEPLLDEAMHELDDTDRAAVLLRYFENKSLREVGATLGTSDDAAQKRVSRAVERLREFFSKRGVAVGVSGLVVVISANAVQAAPVGLAVTISSAAVLAGTAVQTSTTIAVTKAIAMTALQKTIIAVMLAAAAGTGIYEAHQVSRLHEQNQTLQQQQAPLAEQIRELQRQRDDATNQLAAVNNEIARLQSGQQLNELLKLRGQVGALQQSLLSNLQTNSVSSAIANLLNDPAQRALNQIQAHEDAKDKYSTLAKTLNLSPSDADKFFGLISDNEMKKRDLIAAVMSGNMDVTTALQQRDEAKTEMENQLKTLLGDSGYAQYDKFNLDSFAEDRVNALNRELGSNAFNDEQRKQIKAVFAATPPIPLEYIDSFRSKESMDAFFQQWTDQYRSELQQAAQFLTPEQAAAAFTCQSNIINRIQTQINLSQQLYSRLAKQNAQ